MRAGMADMMVAQKATLGFMAMAGNKASPSLEMALPIKAAKGMTPLIYRAVTST